MHGVILYELERYANRRVGPERCRAILHELGLQDLAFTPVETQPDARVLGFAAALARAEGITSDELMREFGAWLAPHLLALYAPLIPAGWGPAEILEHVEDVIHRAVRLRDPDATPPVLATRRIATDVVEIDYGSQRHLCAFAMGLVQGIANSHGRVAEIEQPRCMLLGDATCVIAVRLR